MAKVKADTEVLETEKQEEKGSDSAPQTQPVVETSCPDEALNKAQSGTGEVASAITAKTLGNTDINGTAQNVPDVVTFGHGDMFKLICKASSEAEGWMKSTKAMHISGSGVVVQVTTQQRNPDGSYAVAEALTFVPQARIIDDLDGDGHLAGRHIES